MRSFYRGIRIYKEKGFYCFQTSEIICGGKSLKDVKKEIDKLKDKVAVNSCKC